ncbi:MAG: major facilitator superfamily 1 [Bryobacterales bacterium]|nr:major facilitator superfamily 1 [Bryobacterales bacterium]
MNSRQFGVVVAGFCSFLQMYSTQPLLPMLTGIFHASKIAVSMTVTLAGLGVAVAAPIAGILADRIGRKRVIVWSAFLLGICSLAAATSPGLNTLLFWRFCQGLCTPGVFSVTVAYINDEWSGGGAGSVLSSYVSGTVLGGFSCRFISGLVASHLGWRWVFVVLGVLTLAGAAAIARLLEPERHVHHAISEGSWFSAVKSHLKNRRLLGTYVVGFCVLFSLVAIFTYVTFYLAAPPFNLEPAALGSIFFVYLIGAAANPVAGRAIDRYGQRMVLACSIGAGVAGVSLTLIHNLWMVGLGLTICSSGVFAAQTAANSFVGAAAEHHRSLAVGLYAAFYYVGGGLGAAIPGYFWNLGGWTAVVVFIACVQILTVSMALVFWKGPVRATPAAGFVGAPELE